MENTLHPFSPDEAVSELRTIADLLRWTVSCFNTASIYYGHGTDNPWDEAISLILPSIFLPLDLPRDMWTARLTLSERRHIVERVSRRINECIPVAYLTHKAWFCQQEFYVDERVLIPRSPIGELITRCFSGLLFHTPHHILDMCTGSGCIAIACAYAFPDAQVDAVDISDDVLAVTEYNIQQHCLEQQVTPILSDLFHSLPAIRYDLIVANPPYVDATDMSDLPREYHFEPKLGLAAGKDGLDIIRRILATAANFMADDAVLICEAGNSMAHLIAQYPDIPFTLLPLEKGGQGVFMLTRQQLQECAHRFIKNTKKSP